MSSLPPALESLILSDPLLSASYTFVKAYMSRYDASHDLSHIHRVASLAHQIYLAPTTAAATVATAAAPPPALDLRVILLSALLHDVGDRKYLEPGEDASTLVSATLVSFPVSPPCPPDLARRVQAVCLGVSYTSEAADPAATAALVARYPELGVVQDADRLDAIGAVGVGRLFTYGGARTRRGMAATMEHLDEKLVRLEGMMKTAEGRRLARERTERILTFRAWWVEETAGLGEGERTE